MSIQFEIPITQEMLQVVSRIDRFRGDWSARPGISAERLSKLAEAARIQSIGASCRLSGIHVSDNEVAGILRGDSMAPVSDTKAVHGYSAAIDIVLPDRPVLDSATLSRLNAIVLGKAPAEPGGEIEPSEWRQSESHCETFDAEGRATGRVIPILPPRMIEGKVEDLLTWYELELREGRRHPLPIIGAFVLGLMAISPFEWGNGRTIRVLTAHLIRRAGYDHIPYASLENRMEDLREVYYEAFDRSQSGIWTGTGDISPWLEYFMEVLDRHRERVEAKITLERAASDLTPLQSAILDTVREHGTVDAGLLLKATGANRNTLKDNLRRLVSRGILEKTGERRTTRYRLASYHKARDAAGVEPS